jgi:hypothetical protein
VELVVVLEPVRQDLEPEVTCLVKQLNALLWRQRFEQQPQLVVRELLVLSR